MDKVHMAYNDISGNYLYCDCDVSEVEISEEVLIDEEIFKSFSRHFTGPNCPF